MMLRVIAANTTPPRGVLLAPGVALILLHGPDRADGAPRISFRGQAVPAPYGVVTISAEPNLLQIAALRLPDDPHGDLPMLVATGDGEHLPLYASELDSEPFAIAAGLDQSGRWHLLEFLLNFCCAAFRIGRSASFARFCTGLALECARNAGVATVEARVLDGRMLLSGMHVPAGSTLCVIGPRTVTHSTTPVVASGGLQVVAHVRGGDLIVACGANPAVWTVDEPAAVADVLSLPENGRVSGAVARAVCRQSVGRGIRNASADQFLREMDVLYPAPARKIDDPLQPIGGEIELAIPDESGGIFIAGWLRDPLGMIDTMEIATESGRIPLSPDSMARVLRPDIAKRFASAAHRGTENKHGFVAYIADLPGG